MLAALLSACLPRRPASRMTQARSSRSANSRIVTSSQAVPPQPPASSFPPCSPTSCRKGAAVPCVQLPPLDSTCPVITSAVPGTWAHDTMSRRVRATVLATVINEMSGLGENVAAALKQLDAEMAEAATTPLRLVHDTGAVDKAEWEYLMNPVVAAGETWLSAKWLTAEFYFYRRVLEATGYFQEGSGRLLDPFQNDKDKGLETACEAFGAVAGRIRQAVQGSIPKAEALRLGALLSLWGNRMDLSLWPASTSNEGKDTRAADAIQEALKQGESKLLCNDLDDLIAYLLPDQSPPPGSRIDIVTDNAGFELVSDLCLADILVACGVADKVILRLKGHPTFVSDAMAKDVLKTVAQMQSNTNVDIAALAEGWNARLENEEWVLTEDMYWAQPYDYWEMPDEIAESLSLSRIMFVKGDANYRRLLGDRYWPLDTPFSRVVSYLPTSICALRTLKAELGCGMSTDLCAKAASQDSDWQVSGKYGVVQFNQKAAHSS